MKRLSQCMTIEPEHLRAHGRHEGGPHTATGEWPLAAKTGESLDTAVKTPHSLTNE